MVAVAHSGRPLLPIYVGKKALLPTRAAHCCPFLLGEKALWLAGAGTIQQELMSMFDSLHYGHQDETPCSHLQNKASSCQAAVRSDLKTV